MVRMVSTGSVTSGSSVTGSRESETLPSRTMAIVAAIVVTGRRTADETSDTVSSAGGGQSCEPGLFSRDATTRTGASCVSVRCPSTIT